MRIKPEARQGIRAFHARTGGRIAVLDNDPTGSQTVHDVSVVTVLDETEYAPALGVAGSTCFILTNTRSLPESSAVELTSGVADDLFRLGARLRVPIDVVSRGDSTLRGHVLAEVSRPPRAFAFCGYEWVTSHVFRKTIATLMDQAGTTPRAVADQLGHTRPSMSQNKYMSRRRLTGAESVLEAVAI